MIIDIIVTAFIAFEMCQSEMNADMKIALTDQFCTDFREKYKKSHENRLTTRFIKIFSTRSMRLVKISNNHRS